ncbi:MAG: hypothetical protein IKN05_11165, partial [Clostridia bacterium]|nr:hypothetical protein [Clostridia bacterium]
MKSSFRKFLAVLLTVTMLWSTAIPAVVAEEIAADLAIAAEQEAPAAEPAAEEPAAEEPAAE